MSNSSSEIAPNFMNVFLIFGIKKKMNHNKNASIHLAKFSDPVLLDKLHNLSVRDLIPNFKPLISVDSDTPITQVLKILNQNEILACPLMEGEDKTYLGFVDVLDILAFVLKTYSEGENLESMQWSAWCQDIDSLTHRGIEFGKTKAKVVLNASAEDKWCPVYPTGSLYQLCEVFARGIHRVPVWRDSSNDKTKQIETIVTQSDVVKLLIASDRGELSTLLNMTIRELGIGTRENVISMTMGAQAIHAFWLMYYHKVFGVAITDQTGRLVGNLSASDIRGLGTDLDFKSLLLPIREFFAARFHTRRLLPPIAVTLNTPISLLLQKISLFRVHRVWIVNEDFRPIGLVSLTDIMKLLVDLEPKLT